MTFTTEHLAEKCKHCHLFIEPNLDAGPGIAEYMHLHRGDEADEALDADHEPEPSGMIATLATWREYGPREMRARFHDHLHPVPKGTPRIKARMQPKVWVRDQLVDAGARIEFDITAQVLEMGEAIARSITDNSYQSDELWETAVERAEVDRYPGPVTVYCKDAIRDFFAQEAARKEMGRNFT